jgi:RNA-directed DNA polymerase
MKLIWLSLLFIHKEYQAGIFLNIMKIPQEHINEIGAAFRQMKSKEDLLSLLNHTKNIFYGEKAVPFRLKALTYYSNPTLSGNRYREFAIRKKSGGTRKIHAPIKGLKSIQRILDFVLQCVFEPNEAATGFVHGKSIVDNAIVHTGNNYVFNTDLKDFFPSIELHRVKACFKLPPFNLSDEKEPLAFLLANLCCTQLEVERLRDGIWEKEILPVLPQGAPTSPTITNIICQKLDHRLNGLARRFNLNFTRYADDITFSSMHNVYQKDSDFINELSKIIQSQNFNINEKKTRLQKSGYRQEVTGLIVNKKVNVNQRYIDQIRMWLYYWEKYGYQKAEQIFLKDYTKDKGHIRKAKPNMVNVLSGKLEFLRMVKGKDDPQYQKNEKRFLILLDKKQGIPGIEQILDVWENEGIEQAMEISNLKID